MTSLSPIAALATGPQAPSERTQLRQAARQFEALFVRQMLGAARAARLGGENDLFGGQAMDTFNGMQDERFAQIAADSGALGLARSIETQLAAQLHLSGAGTALPSARPEPVEGPHATPGIR